MLGLGGGMGVAVAYVPTWMKWHMGAFYIVEVYQQRGDKYHLLITLKKALSTESFTTGKNREFIVPSPAPVLFYRYGKPVLQYVVNKARPRHAKISPESVAINDPPTKGKDKGATLPDTESRSVSLFFARGAIRQMIQATKGVDLKVAFPFVILAAVAAFAVAYAIFVNVHPGFFPAPPPGYCYKAVPWTNATHVTVSGCSFP